MTESTRTSSRTFKDYLGITLRGLIMGAADVVPGVSGGTMAFILGIYEELIESIGMFTRPDVWKLALRFDIKGLLERLPWKFLLALGVGILGAIVSLAQFLEYALENHPSLLWAFFFGLVVASVLTIFHRVKVWNGATIAAAIVGTVFAYFLVGMVPTQTPDTWWFLFFSGAIAICAMILPGISGSFILLLLGKYQTIIAAVNQRDVITLFWVACGIVIGITTFARLLGWLFARYHDLTVALLIGFMIGSLRKIWPWKHTLEVFIDRHGKEVPLIQQNIIPDWSPAVGLGLALAAAGMISVLLLHYVATRQAEC